MNLRTFWISVQSSCRLRAVNRRSETPTLPMLLCGYRPIVNTQIGAS
jgi:hypothetical protein